MDNMKTDVFYIERILNDLAYISRHMNSIGPEAFSSDEILQDAMMFRLIQVSENARKLTEGYKKQHSMIPWTAMYGLRNRIVHDYGNVDLGIVYETLKRDIPVLLELITKEAGK